MCHGMNEPHIDFWVLSEWLAKVLHTEYTLQIGKK